MKQQPHIFYSCGSSVIQGPKQNVRIHCNVKIFVPPSCAYPFDRNAFWSTFPSLLLGACSWGSSATTSSTSYRSSLLYAAVQYIAFLASLIQHLHISTVKPRGHFVVATLTLWPPRKSTTPTPAYTTESNLQSVI